MLFEPAGRREVDCVRPRLGAGLHLGADEVRLLPADPTRECVNAAGALTAAASFSAAGLAIAGLLSVPATSAKRTRS